MKKLPFVNQPGNGPGQSPRCGSLADLVLALPYVLGNEIPPRRVLNDVLRRGSLDAGMSGGCLWEPFEVNAATYEALVAELQRRGTRPVMGRDPGGKPFRRSNPPATVRTYRHWATYRARTSRSVYSRLAAIYERWLASRSPLADDPAHGHVLPDYDRWHDELPVADLYLDYLGALDSDWRTLSDDAFELPAELVSRLRELAQLIDEWLYDKGAGASDYRRWLQAWSEQTQRVRRETQACVDRLGLPRWPYKRSSVPAS